MIKDCPAQLAASQPQAEACGYRKGPAPLKVQGSMSSEPRRSTRSTAERARDALAKVRHFAGLPRHVQEAVANAAVPRRYAAGQVIYLEGEPGTTAYILESGWG